ncbi:MAG: hypothetical protein HOE54_08910, partial [Gammaproteobacteria bacterium]|nr:hypothetical protein [Gammaproteobacteria bacterium]
RQAVDEFMQTLDTPDKFTRAMKTINIAWGYVRDPHDLPSQPTLDARGTFTEVEDRDGGKRHVVQSPYHFSDATSGVRGPTAHRGEHYREVLSDWLDMDHDSADTLLENKILLYDPNWRHH